MEAGVGGQVARRGGRGQRGEAEAAGGLEEGAGMVGAGGARLRALIAGGLIRGSLISVSLISVGLQ